MLQHINFFPKRLFVIKQVCLQAGSPIFLFLAGSRQKLNKIPCLLTYTEFSTSGIVRHGLCDTVIGITNNRLEKFQF